MSNSDRGNGPFWTLSDPIAATAKKSPFATTANIETNVKSDGVSGKTASGNNTSDVKIETGATTTSDSDKGTPVPNYYEGTCGSEAETIKTTDTIVGAHDVKPDISTSFLEHIKKLEAKVNALEKSEKDSEYIKKLEAKVNALEKSEKDSEHIKKLEAKVNALEKFENEEHFKKLEAKVNALDKFSFQTQVTTQEDSENEELETGGNALETSEKYAKQLEEENQEDSDEDDEDTKFPGDCYSMMALNGPAKWSNPKSLSFFLFGFMVFTFQILFLILLVYSQVDQKRGTVEESDNPDADADQHFFAKMIPPNNQNVVIVTQIVALLAYIMFPESSMEDVVTACRLFPPESTNNKGVVAMRLSSILRFIQGSAAIVVVWILVMTSSAPVDIILNFTAINFVSDLDETAFSLAESGVFGKTLKKEAQRIVDTTLPVSVQQKRTHVWYWIVMAFWGSVLFAFMIYVLVNQISSEKWLAQTIRIEFNGKSFNKYSGCFSLEPDAKKNFKRYTYYSHDKELNTSIGYCREERTWILFSGEGETMDPCEANDEDNNIAIARSADTDSFDISAVFDERWVSSIGAPLNMFFFESTDESELNCDLSVGDGRCDVEFNDPGFDYDQGDCCAKTCEGPKCGRGGITNAFGVPNKIGSGFPTCKDEDMVPITIRLNAITNMRDTQEYPGFLCERDYYITEDMWRSTTPSPTNFDLECDGKLVLNVNIDQSMEGQSETVWVNDGANCTVTVQSTISTSGRKWHDYFPCFYDPLWFINYTLFHGDEDDSNPVEILTQQSSENPSVSFRRLPECYVETLGKRFDPSTLYSGPGSQDEAVDWLLGDREGVSKCGDDDFATRFFLVNVNYATSSDVEFMNREKHCNWDATKCGAYGELIGIDLHAIDLDGRFPFPEAVTAFQGLETLQLFDNDLTSIDLDVTRLTNLKELDIDENLFQSLPTEIGNMVGLERLYFSENEISLVPTEIGQLTRLQRLHMSRNPLTSIPSELRYLTNLYQLELDESNHTSIPTGIGMLESLKELYLKNNDLTFIPTELGHLTKLENFYIHFNELLSVPTEIGMMTSLKRLYLGFNQISSLPTEIGLLTNLERLYLGANLLSSIPSEIGLLTKLERFYLENNLLSSIPTEISLLTGLSNITLAENNVTCDDLPEDLLAVCSDSDGALDMLIGIEFGGE